MAAAEVTGFASQSALRGWFERNHRKQPVLVMRLMRKHVAHRGVTYAEALDEALCFGWIDGVRRALDADSFTVRFTPRRRGSIWSRVNVGHVERLRAAGRMTEAGEAAYAARSAARTGVYSFEQRPATLPREFQRRFKANKTAWKYFAAQPPGYRRTSLFWVVSAKQAATRERRLQQLISDSANGLRIAQLRR